MGASYIRPIVRAGEFFSLGCFFIPLLRTAPSQPVARDGRGKRDTGSNADRSKRVISTERTCAERIT